MPFFILAASIYELLGACNTCRLTWCLSCGSEFAIFAPMIHVIKVRSQVLENLCKTEAEKSTEMLVFLSSLFSVRKV